MPSTILFPQSGGIQLVSGQIFSGVGVPIGGVQLKLAKLAPGTVYVGLPTLSGDVPTFLSGGSLSSGGMADGMELNPGDSYFIPKARLFTNTISGGITGLGNIYIGVPAASSGGRLFWERF